VPVSRADIVASYRFILGGEPENKIAIAWHRKGARCSVRALFGDSGPAPAASAGYRAACPTAAGDRD
jgi:hypothetical protein